MTRTEPRARLQSRWQKWRRDPVAFAADLPSAALSRAMLLGLAGIAAAADLLDRRARRAARIWRREGVHLARSATDDVYRFATRDGRAPSVWPDGLLIVSSGAAMVAAAVSDDGEWMTAAHLAADRPGLLRLGGRSVSCRIYRIDGRAPPEHIEVRPVGRAGARRSLRRAGVGRAEALRAAWPPIERSHWAPDRRAYRAWIARNEPRLAERDAIRAWLVAHSRLPSIGVLIALSDPSPAMLDASLRSLRGQIHGGWRASIVGPAPSSAEARRVLQEALKDSRTRWLAAPNAADLAGAEFVLPLAAGDLLAPHALAMLAVALADAPDAVAAYADHDMVDITGQRMSPMFKPDLDRTWLQSRDYVGGGLAVRTDVLGDVGGPGPDLARRVAESGRGQVLHLPHVLTHVRRPPADPPRPPSATRRAAGAPPPVLAIVPTRDRPELLEACVAGLLNRTAYPTLELCIVDNGSRTPEALGLLARLERSPRVQVLRIGAPFNFSALNNAAAAGAKARLLAFINDDILVVEPGWLAAMAALAVHPEAGAVGAKLLYPNGSLQHGGIVLGLGPPRIAGHGLRGAPGDAEGPMHWLQTTRQASAVTAACMVLERRKFEAVGGFDADAFPVAFNDVDLCLRLAARGYRTLWTPEARLFHLESATRRTDRTGAARVQFEAEAAGMRQRWGDRLTADPYYNPNLTLEDERFTLASRSRAVLPWR